VTEEEYFSESTGKVSIGTPREQFKKSQKFKVSPLCHLMLRDNVPDP
jgi:hypothetical protein